MTREQQLEMRDRLFDLRRLLSRIDRDIQDPAGRRKLEMMTRNLTGLVRAWELLEHAEVAESR